MPKTLHNEKEKRVSEPWTTHFPQRHTLGEVETISIIQCTCCMIGNREHLPVIRLQAS